MKTLAITLTVLLLTAASCFAIEWVIVPGAQTDGDIICLDRDNVVKENGIISAWIKRFKEGGNSTKTLLEFDCPQGKTKMVKSVNYDKSAKKATMVTYESAWENSGPETPAEAAAVMICRKGKGFNPALISMREKQ